MPELRSKQPDIVRLPVPANARVAVALQPKPVPVVLHFVKPVRADRDNGGLGGDAEIKRLKHAAEIGARGRFCEHSAPVDLQEHAKAAKVSLDGPYRCVAFA